MDRSLRMHRSSRASTLDRDAGDVWSVVASGTEGPHWYVDALPLLVRARWTVRWAVRAAGPSSSRPTSAPLAESGS